MKKGQGEGETDRETEIGEVGEITVQTTTYVHVPLTSSTFALVTPIQR